MSLFRVAPRNGRLVASAGTLLLVLGGATSYAQSDRGSVQFITQSSDGVPLAANGTLLSLGRQFEQHFATGADGRFLVPQLMFGTYNVIFSAPGFASLKRTVQILSPLPITLQVRLFVAPVRERVSIDASTTLLDSGQAGYSVGIGRQQLQDKLTSQPGRGFLDVIADQPGWVFEANGVLHPRGAEYDTQFVVNGVPRTENLSPSFADPLSTSTVESAQVRTAGIPAEYGRSLGGIVEITTGTHRAPGWHGSLAAFGGSFESSTSEARLGFGTESQQLSLSGEGSYTDRFLDPPVLANYTNQAHDASGAVDEQISASRKDHIQLDYSYAWLQAMIPNELVQQQSGQRQDRGSRQNSGSASWQRSVTPDLLLTAAGGVLGTEVSLSSNADSTPVDVQQQRGFGQGWVHTDLAGHHGHNDWKAGADAVLRHVHEQLSYAITDPTYFDPGTQPDLHFAQKLWDSEPAAFAEDTLQLGHWSLAAGLRYDRYSFVLQQSAWSPRASISRYFPSAHVAVHASYDRVFQVPAIENLLLASSPAFDSVSSFVRRLPVEPARAHYYEFGFSDELASKLRITGNVFLRTFRNFPDDDTLLNTGVSFPISDASARVRGQELSVYLPDWKHVLLQLSYSNQVGTASGPITGGLFIGAEGADELGAEGRFAISQDQRNTVRARARWSPVKMLWFGVHAQYNSGLPVELGPNIDMGALRAAYGEQIISSVNFERGRVRPWSSVDLVSGLELLRHPEHQLDLQFQVSNVEDRVNVINFASLLSGTALGVPRSYDARLRFTF